MRGLRLTTTGPSGPAPSLPPGFSGAFDVTPEACLRASASTGPVSIAPLAVARPAHAEDVVTLVRTAASRGWTLTPRGGATGMPGGNVGPGIAVDMTHGFGYVSAPDIERFTITAGVGATLADVAAEARAHGMDLPPMPSSADRCTVGGVVANNAAGARSFRHGSIRDWVVDLEAVLPDGTLVGFGNPAGDPAPSGPFGSLAVEFRRDRAWADGWPRVRKNSSGYAIDAFAASGLPRDLLIGSEGTLALLTRVRLQLRRSPDARAVHVVALPSRDHLLQVVAMATELGAAACEFLGKRFLVLGEVGKDPILGDMARGHWGLAIIEFEGTPERVASDEETASREWESLGCATRSERTEDGMAALWGIRHRASPIIKRSAGPNRVSMQFIEDSVVPPDRLLDYLSALDGALAEEDMDAVSFGHAGDGNVHVNPLVDVSDPTWRDRVGLVLADVTRAVRALGGTLSGEHGDGRIRAPLLSSVWSAPAVDAFGRVKSALDPAGMLNPGVILPLPGQHPLDGIEGCRK